MLSVKIQAVKFHSFQDFWEVKNQVKMLTDDQVKKFKVPTYVAYMHSLK